MTLTQLSARRAGCILWATFCCCALQVASGADWLLAGAGVHQPVWGLRGGLQFAICPGGFTGGNGGPRGLIRIGYPTLLEGNYDLINFIAVEPIVNGVRGYSELEKSHYDDRAGKMFWTGTAPASNDSVAVQSPGVITTLTNGIEELSVTVLIEKFDNGAHVRLVLRQRSDAPDELRLIVQAEPDSAPIQSCILTATMGNKARARQLWLKAGAVSSLKLFGDYTGSNFASKKSFSLAQLPRTVAGDALVAMTTDEANPAAAPNQPAGWEYRGAKVTQYWRKPAAGVNDSLRCAVNARFAYWMSHTPVPGGLAFENFELVDDFKDGEEFFFGVTQHLPGELLK